MDFSSLQDSDFGKQHSYANKGHNWPLEENIVLDSKAIEGVLINHDSTITLISDKEFIQDFEVKDKMIIQEDLEIIDMIMLIPIEDKKVILEVDLVEKVKFSGRHIKQSTKNLKKNLQTVCLYKSTVFRKVILKNKKKLKFWYFRVSRKFDAKHYVFKLRDYLLLYYKFHPLDCLLFSAKLEDEFFRKGGD